MPSTRCSRTTTNPAPVSRCLRSIRSAARSSDRFYLLVGSFRGHRLQRRFAESLPDACLPIRHPGAERADRHHHQQGLLLVQLQPARLEFRAAFRLIAAGLVPDRRSLRQCPLYRANGRVQIVAPHARLPRRPERPQRARLPAAALLRAGHLGRRGSAVPALLHRRRKRSARLRHSLGDALCFHPNPGAIQPQQS